ncbi:hypothetical protein [Dankookia sp. P2]|uniref:hypothetical protein n=1 Tax=Dankookia sp. P2 TaxID=3423955 RepID=UPI003D66DC58
MEHGMGLPLRLTAPGEVLARLVALLPGPVAPGLVPVAAALGRVLAADLTAPGPVPAAPVALQPGWAVAAAETLGAGPYAPVLLAAAPARVAPGDLLPPAATPCCRPSPWRWTVPSPRCSSRWRRARGAAAGRGGRRRHHPAPRRGAAGAARPAGAGRLRDRGGRGAAAAHRLGGRGGTPPALRRAGGGRGGGTRRGGPGADPAGRRPRGARGGALLLHGIGARPGMAAGLGRIGGIPALLLSARAEEALAAWVLLGRPALRHLAAAPPPPPIRARLARKVASAVGLLEIVPVRLPEPGLAEPLAIGALPAGLLAAADALLLVLPGVEG